MITAIITAVIVGVVVLSAKVHVKTAAHLAQVQFGQLKESQDLVLLDWFKSEFPHISASSS